MATWATFQVYSSQNEYHNKNIQPQMAELIIIFLIFRTFTV